jgi:hypothetical protein
MDEGAWEEEREVLTAIYDADVSFPADRHVLLQLPHEEGFLPLQLDFRIGDAYPNQLPVLAVR